jgi:SAM-dependent methyltransferase
MAAPLYESIGRTYSNVRRPDPRIARRLHRHLGDASNVINVGAGSGSYEPTDRAVIAVEPSPTMISQRPTGAAPVVRGVADALPFADDAFDAALALLTIHHWPDQIAGLRELRRVTRGPIVAFGFEFSFHGEQWLVSDYLPEMIAFDLDTLTPAQVAEVLGGGTVEVLPVPHDCVDGFCHAYWRRPDAYLDPVVRAGISGIARLPDDIVEPAMGRLADDLRTGAWARRHADLVDLEELDVGYRIVVSPG